MENLIVEKLDMSLEHQVLTKDCFLVFPEIPDNSIDMVLADLPYGTIAAQWDKVVDMKVVWQEFERILKPDGIVVLTATLGFGIKLIMSKQDWFRYEWIWAKTKSAGFVHAKNKPLLKHEYVLVFSKYKMGHASTMKQRMRYNPQGLKPALKIHKNGKKHFKGQTMGKRPSHKDEFVSEFTNYPSSILHFPNDSKVIHPTQKPVALFEYLIRTYTEPNQIVLDPTAGRLTTTLAAMKSGRKSICIEMDEKMAWRGKHWISSEINGKKVNNG